MLIEIDAIDPDTVYDCCVIGSGPAGMTAAMRLADHGLRVLLLEAGEFGPTSESQDVYRAEVIGDPYFDLSVARLRCFGGTSGHWTGWCRPLDAEDLEERPGFENMAWPIRRADLDPFLPEAARILEIPGVFEDETPSPLGVKRIRFEFSPPVLFAVDYGDQVEDSPNIDLCMRANVFSLQPEGDRIASVEVMGYEGERATARAAAFVLACGGIENSRILLYSNAISNGGVVRRPETLGRYWMEHPHFTIGTAFYFDGGRRSGHVGLTAAARTELGVLNCGLRLQNPNYRGRNKTIADLACVAPQLAEWAAAQIGQRLVCGYRLRAAWEQEPRSVNRVALSAAAVDAFGVPRAELHWTKSDADLRTVRETALRFGRELAETDVGRVRLERWVLGEADYPTNDELAGYHHMGGTRMADSPERGVVDRDLRVFGLDNLYVCGSSVFPSAGHANPTLTIVQLALRLGDHIATRRT